MVAAVARCTAAVQYEPHSHCCECLCCKCMQSHPQLQGAQHDLFKVKSIRATMFPQSFYKLGHAPQAVAHTITCLDTRLQPSL